MNKTRNPKDIKNDTVYLVTGAGGHLGGAIVRELLSQNKCVYGLVRSARKKPPERIPLLYADITDKKALEECFLRLKDKKVILFHCAGIVSIKSGFDQKIQDVNVQGTKNIVDLCKKYSIHKLLYVSSVHAIPERPFGEIIQEVKDFSPDTVVGAYAKSKAEATKYVLEKASGGLPAVVIHPSGIIGPFDSGKNHTTAMILDYYKGKLLFGIKGAYDFVDVRDVALGAVLAAEKGRLGECYILSNQVYTIQELLNTLHLITGKKEVKLFLPRPLLKVAAYFAEVYYKLSKKPPLFTLYSIYTFQTNAHFSHEKASNELGYTTRDLTTTLKDTLDWLKKEDLLP